MQYMANKQRSNMNGEMFVRARLVNVKNRDLRWMAKILATEGSTVSESDIMAVVTLLSNRLPALIALGNQITLPGIGTLMPTIQGSITESEWRKTHDEEFTADALTQRDLHLSYKLKIDTEFEQAMYNFNEWERVKAL